MQIQKLLPRSILGIFLLALSACGGGGGSDSSSNQPSSNTPVNPTLLDTTPPTAISAMSSSSILTVPIKFGVTMVSFNESVQNGSSAVGSAENMNNIIVTNQSTGLPVPITLSLDSTKKNLTITAVSSQAYLTNFLLKISGVKDLAGNTMSSPFTLVFRTESAVVQPTNITMDYWESLSNSRNNFITTISPIGSTDSKSLKYADGCLVNCVASQAIDTNFSLSNGNWVSSTYTPSSTALFFDFSASNALAPGYIARASASLDLTKATAKMLGFNSYGMPVAVMPDPLNGNKETAFVVSQICSNENGSTSSVDCTSSYFSRLQAEPPIFVRRLVQKTTDGVNWQTISTDSRTARNFHSLIVGRDPSNNNKNTLFMIAGFSSGYKNDVVSSTDGVNWITVTASAAFSPRGHTQVVSLPNSSGGDDLFLLGGKNDTQVFDDVWKSSDGGKTWIQVSTSIFSSPQEGFVATVNSNGTNKGIIVAGGYNATSQTYSQDVLLSADGTTWTKIGFLPTDDIYSKMLVRNQNGNQTIVLFGDRYNSVYTSLDNGARWSITSINQFSVGGGSSGYLLNNQLFVFGGASSWFSLNKGYISFYRDIWRSSDGVNWYKPKTISASFK